MKAEDEDEDEDEASREYGRERSSQIGFLVKSSSDSIFLFSRFFRFFAPHFLKPLLAA